VPGFLEDHAFVVQGLIDLYEAPSRCAGCGRRSTWPRPPSGSSPTRGRRLVRLRDDHERLIAREKPSHDGAEPSGASVAVLNALRLSAFTADDRWREVAERALRAHASTLAEHPQALHDMLLAVDFHGDAVREVVLVWPAGEPAPEPFLRVLRETFLPSRALAGAAEGPALEALGQVAR